MTTPPGSGGVAVASASVVRKSVLAVLGWSAQEYSKYLASPTGTERRQLDAYARICAEMGARSKQWGRRLMLSDGDVKADSSYVAAYSQSRAPETVSGRADLRMEYLGQLYDMVPKQELRLYGELLNPTVLHTGCVPDTQAAYVLYRFEDAFKMTVAGVETTGVYPRDYHSAGPHGSQTIAFTGFLLDKMLMRVFGPSEVNRDSLASRLLLNACINRALLEGAELNRVNTQAAESARGLLMHLHAEFGSRLPTVDNHTQLRPIVERVMSKPAAGNWRKFKGSVLDTTIARAIIFAREDRKAMAGLTTEAEVCRYMLLASLAVAWSYCRAERFDTRQFGDDHREHDVFNGFVKESPGLCPPGLTRYHHVQFELLHASAQHERLDVEALLHVHGLRQFQRDLLGDYFRSFKTLTLAQWAKLERELLQCPGRQYWAKQLPLVAQGAAWS